MFLNTRSKIDVALEVLRILNPPVVMPKENNFEVNEDDMGSEAMAMLKNATATFIAQWLKDYVEPTQQAPQQQAYKSPIDDLVKALAAGQSGGNNFWNK
jgi:hypothetical protein